MFKSDQLISKSIIMFYFPSRTYEQLTETQDYSIRLPWKVKQPILIPALREVYYPAILHENEYNTLINNKLFSYYILR